MEIEKFKQTLNEAKQISKETAFIGWKVIKVNDTKYKLVKDVAICKICKQHWANGILVEFYKPQQLTIFKAGMLYSIFAENKRPYNYAQYHKCQAGKEFIENIKEITKMW